ncbi:MAG: hypothetical protein ACREBR_04825 [bacterium]
MKIDYTQWYYEIADYDTHTVQLTNPTLNWSTTLFLNSPSPAIISVDDIDKWFREKCKEKIREMYLSAKLREVQYTKSKRCVEDNLQFLELKSEEKEREQDTQIPTV